MFHTANILAYPLLKQYAAYNRAHPTEAEIVLWQQIRGKQCGCKFLRQYIIGDYIVDFVCLSKQLVIELDGAYHYQGIQPALDAQRQAVLEQMGFRVIRFTNNEILCQTDQIIAQIKALLQ